MSELTKHRPQSHIAIYCILLVSCDFVHLKIKIRNPCIIICSIPSFTVNRRKCLIITFLQSITQKFCIFQQSCFYMIIRMQLIIFSQQDSHSNTFGTLIPIDRITVASIIQIYFILFVIINHESIFTCIGLFHLLMVTNEVNPFFYQAVHIIDNQASYVRLFPLPIKNIKTILS